MFLVLDPVKLPGVKSLLLESQVGCWIWQKTKQGMHFTPMRASISTIPYGTEAPPPRSIPVEGLIHASSQSFPTSFLALGSTGLIRFGPVTKEDFLHTHMLKNILRHTCCRRSWTQSRSEWRWRHALGQCFRSLEEYIYYHHLNHKTKSLRIYTETPAETSHRVGPFFSRSSENSPKVCGALEERSALKWIFSSVPKCFSWLTQFFFHLSFRKCSQTIGSGCKCLESTSIWFVKRAD